ncbi:MAG: type II toxin-antitoxin system HicA family toxin [Geminicoccaceae bacterium]|nr:type II toxin-antitoxin system HicA family toxin [Geminicoccaceae bacterium]
MLQSSGDEHNRGQTYGMKYRDLEKLLTAHGFELIRQQGSHRHFQGFVDGKRCIVTLA